MHLDFGSFRQTLFPRGSDTFSTGPANAAVCGFISFFFSLYPSLSFFFSLSDMWQITVVPFHVLRAESACICVQEALFSDTRGHVAPRGQSWILTWACTARLRQVGARSRPAPGPIFAVGFEQRPCKSYFPRGARAPVNGFGEMHSRGGRSCFRTSFELFSGIPATTPKA